MREKWAASFGSDKELWKMEERGELALFLSKDKPDNNPSGRSPVYHVWRGNKWLYCGTNLQEAYRIYNRELDGSRKE